MGNNKKRITIVEEILIEYYFSICNGLIEFQFDVNKLACNANHYNPHLLGFYNLPSMEKNGTQEETKSKRGGWRCFY
jgi:hypothetical protein